MPLFKLITPSTRSAQQFEVARWLVNGEIDERVWDEMIARLQRIMNCRATYFYITWFDGEDHCTVQDIHDLREAVQFYSQSPSKEKAIRLYASVGKREHLTAFGGKPSSAEFASASQAEGPSEAIGCPYPNQSGNDGLNSPLPTVLLPTPEDIEYHRRPEGSVDSYQGNLGFEYEPQGRHPAQPSTPRASNKAPNPSAKQMAGSRTEPEDSKSPLSSKSVTGEEHYGESSDEEGEEGKSKNKSGSPGIKRPQAHDQMTVGDAEQKKREEELSRHLKEVRSRESSKNRSKDLLSKEDTREGARGQTAPKAENSETIDDESLRSYISALKDQGLDLDEYKLKKMLMNKDRLQKTKPEDKNRPDNETQSGGSRHPSDKSDESIERIPNEESSDSYPDDYPKDNTEPYPFRQMKKDRGGHQASSSTKKEPVVIPSPSIPSPSARGARSQGGGRRTPKMSTKSKEGEGVRGPRKR